MSTRTRRPTTHEQAEHEEPTFLFNEERGAFDLEGLSDEELEDLLFDDEEEPSKGFWNLPTLAGLSMILVGIVYLLDLMGLTIPFNVGAIIPLLPVLAGVLIILLGFGVLSWRPKKKKKRVKKTVELPSGKEKVVVEKKSKGDKKRLQKARNKKIAGVAGGIAEYFNLDPTLVRIAFVVATVATGGNFIFAYLVLAMIMPKPDKPPKPPRPEGRVTIIRD